MPTTLTEMTAHWGSVLEANAQWGELIIFLVAFAEGLAVAGLIVPGVLILTGTGALVAAGVFDFWSVYIAIVAGAVLGDAVSYWIGRYFGDRIGRFWPFSKRPEMLDKGRAFFDRHGGKSVFLARFVGPLRAVVPITAGMMAMPHRHFQTFNVLSAVIWAPLLMSPGMAAWTGWDMTSGTRNAAPVSAPAGQDADRTVPCAPAPPVSGATSGPGC